MQVSVIIPSYNTAAFIEACIASLGDDPAVGEILVVDNASTDGTPAIVAQLARPGICLVRNAENVGAARARDQGVLLATCPLITFLDADDMLTPGSLSMGVLDLESRGSDLSIFTMNRLQPDGVTVTPFLPALDEAIDGDEAFRRTVGPWRIHPMGVMQRDLYLRARQDFIFHGHADDELLSRRILLAAWQVTGNAGAYLYRVNPKPPALERIVGQNLTGVRSLQIAAEHRDIVPEALLRRARNMVIRDLAGLSYRSLNRADLRPMVRTLLSEVRALRIAWRPADLKFRAMAIAAAVLAGIRSV